MALDEPRSPIAYESAERQEAYLSLVLDFVGPQLLESYRFAGGA